ncbi:hypothetical protein HW132_31965 [Brasilonema sp. CT11]|nr:hypothetical protein [Brasilonema sp. CT11]
MTSSTRLQILISFNGNREITLKSAHQIDDSLSATIVEIIKPFMKFPGNRDRVLQGEYLKITATMRDDILEAYSIGFTTNTRLSSEMSEMSTNH